MLAVEAASTSLKDDRKVEQALCARSRIPEVWIVNLRAEEVEVYHSPVRELYTSITRASRSDTLTNRALPGVLIPVAEIFA